MRVSLVLAFALLSFCSAARAQEFDADDSRVFTTLLRWERVAGVPHSEKLRYADGTLVILYREGVYAEVTASFIKTGGKHPIGLNLNEGLIVRLGTWSRTEDESLIRIQSREVLREQQIQKCKIVETYSSNCVPLPEDPLPGPFTARTCRLEHPSSTHIAGTIVCNGLVVFHPEKAIDLSDFPSIVRKLKRAEESESKPQAAR